jgi:hypothetical protein
MEIPFAATEIATFIASEVFEDSHASIGRNLIPDVAPTGNGRVALEWKRNGTSVVVFASADPGASVASVRFPGQQPRLVYGSPEELAGVVLRVLA